MEKVRSLLSELKEACEKIDFNFEVASKEIQELIGDLKVIDYYVTTEVPSEHFEGTLMDLCILTEKALFGYEVKAGNISLYHIVPLSKVTMISEGIEEEKGEKYVIAYFYWGPLAALGASAKLNNQEKLRKFLIRVNEYTL